MVPRSTREKRRCSFASDASAIVRERERVRKASSHIWECRRGIYRMIQPRGGIRSRCFLLKTNGEHFETVLDMHSQHPYRSHVPSEFSLSRSGEAQQTRS